MQYTTAQFKRSMVNEARQHPTLIEDADGGENLILKTEADERAKDEILRLYDLLRKVESAFRDRAPDPATLGELAYLAHWEPDRRSWFFDGLAEALAVGRVQNDPEPATFFIEYCRPKGLPSPTALDSDFIARVGEALARRRTG